MSTEAQIKRWTREEHKRILLEEQAACLHKRSGSLDRGAGDVIQCDDCKKTMIFDPACRRPPSINPNT